MQPRAAPFTEGYEGEQWSRGKLASLPLKQADTLFRRDGHQSKDEDDPLSVPPLPQDES